MIEARKAEDTSRAILENLCDVVIDNTNKPGVDFFCKKGTFEFCAEVTCLEIETITNQSKIPHIPPEGCYSGRHDMITPTIRARAIRKVNQLSQCKCARLLMIVSYHSAANILLGDHAAELLLTDEQGIAFSPASEDDDGKDLYPYTNYEFTLFFESIEGELSVKRESISAIWLVAVSRNTKQIIGVLNPQPNYNFEYRLFPSVPIVRIKTWPIENNTLETEWVRNTPNWIQDCEPAVRYFENSLEFQQRCWNATSENEKENLKKDAMEIDNHMKQLKLR